MRPLSLLPLAACVWVAAIAGNTVGPIAALIAILPGLVFVMVPDRRMRLHALILVSCGLLLLLPLGALHRQYAMWDEGRGTAALARIDATLTSRASRSDNSPAWDKTWFITARPTSPTGILGQREQEIAAGTRLVLAVDDSTRLPPEIMGGVQGLGPGMQMRVRGTVERDGSTFFIRTTALSAIPGDTAPQHSESLGSVLEDMRQWARARFLSASELLPPDEAALLRGFVIGDAEGLDSNTKEAMQVSGLTHLVAASGANIALVYACVSLPLLLAGLGRKPRVLCAGAGIAAYVWIVGPEPSVLRAASMALPLLVARFIGFRTPALHALALAVLAWSLAAPQMAASPGFMLSVLATGAILGLAPRLAEVFVEITGERLSSPLALALAVPIVAQAACTPVLIMLSPEVSVWAVLANLLAEFFVAPATVVGFMAFLLSLAWPPLASPFVWVSGSGAHVLSLIAQFFASLPGAHISVPPGAQGAIASVLVLCAVGVYLWLRHERLVTAALAVCAALALVVWGLRGPLNTGPGKWDVALCDVGQGDALVLRTAKTADSPVTIIDTGPDPQALTTCLDTLGVQDVALVVLTHPHDDHTGGVYALTGRRSPKEAWVCPLDTSSAQFLPDARVSTPLAGDSARVGDVRFAVAWPPSAEQARALGAREGGGEGSEANDCSLVLTAEIPAGEGAVRLTALGDLEPLAQRALTEAGVGESALVKVAHHGSRRQYPPLYEALKPRVALIGVGENTYGHPHSTTLDMLAAAGARTYRSDRCSLITVEVTDPRELRVRSACRTP